MFPTGKRETRSAHYPGYGKPWTTEGLTEARNKASHRAGREGLGPHALRHTFASPLVIARVDLHTIQELLGHKKLLMTLRDAHLSPDHKRAAMDALESRFAGKVPSIFTTPPLLSQRRKTLPFARIDTFRRWLIGVPIVLWNVAVRVVRNSGDR